MSTHRLPAGSPFDKAVRSPLPEDVQQNQVRARRNDRRELEEAGHSRTNRYPISDELLYNVSCCKG